MCSAAKLPLQGVLPVLHTPFTDSGKIDRETLHREIEWAFQTGADGVVVAMVSEILRLGYHGRKQLAELVCESANDQGFECRFCHEFETQAPELKLVNRL